MDNQKKIAIVGGRGIPAEFGGFETFSEQLAIRLADCGYDVTVFCESTQKYQDKEYKGVKLIYIKTPNIVGVRSVWFDIINIIRTIKGYDVVYMLGYHAGFAFILPWLFRTNFWVNMDGMEWKRSKWSSFAKHYLKINEWLAARFATKLIADAEGIAEYLRNTYNVANKTVMIPYGANIIEQVPDKAIVSGLGFTANEYFLVVCRLEPENHVLEILNGFFASDSNTKLVIVGDHKSGTDYVNKLLEISDERIHFIGTIYNQKKLEALRYHCKAYIHGHSVGGTNPSLLEAMAAGNYVIAHDNVFNREVTGGDASFFDNAIGLTKILNKLESISLEVSREIMLKRIKKIYNWDNISEKYIDELAKHKSV